MDVLLFLARNWHDILAVILLVVSIIVVLEKWIQKNGPLFKKMSLAEKFAYITRLLQNLVPIALVLVTDAEIEFGGGTGPLKRSYVIAELYKLIPDEYKKYITEENLDQIINKALEEAERLWAENPKIKAMMEAY
ncbi:MAG: hypothetical protein RBT15_04770 [Gudongella sp.]|jgi:hypothetical protein|nr:hypothetical protein [Gudongella sp.]